MRLSDRLPMMSRADMSWAMAYQSAAIVRSVTRVNASSLPRTKPVRMVRGTVSLFNTQLTCVLLVFVNELRDPPVVHAALHMEPPSLWDPLRKVAGLVGSTYIHACLGWAFMLASAGHYATMSDRAMYAHQKLGWTRSTRGQGRSGWPLLRATCSLMESPI